MDKPNPPQTIAQYIEGFPEAQRERLYALLAAIREAAPEAKERISWGMPTFTQHGNLVHFARQKHHIGFYPGASGVAAFEAQLEGFQTSKGAIQFPDEKPLPLDLVREIVRYRVGEQQAITNP